MCCVRPAVKQRTSSEPETRPISIGDQRIQTEKNLSNAKTVLNALKVCKLH